MGIKAVKDENHVEDFLKILEMLEGKVIKVGILSDEPKKVSDDKESEVTLLKVAGAHEFGAHITPKKSKYLTIPLSKEYNAVKASEVSGLFFYKSDNGNAFLARKKGKRGKLELCYLLKTSVDIPERSFIRAGYDENEDNIAKRVEILIEDVFSGKINIDSFYEFVGNYCVNRIQQYMRDLDSPALNPITVTNKGSSNPLENTHQMLNAITFEII